MPKQRGRKKSGRRSRPYSTGRKSGVITSNFRKYPGPIQMPPSQAIMVQLRNYLNATSNGSGILAGVIPADPSSTLSATFGSTSLFPEWSDWLALFGSVRVVQLEIKLLSISLDEVKGDTSPGFIMAGNLQSTAVPSNYQSVADNADSQSWNPLQDTTSAGRYHAIRWPRTVLWASATTPAPSSLQFTGCPGGFAIYGDTLPATLKVLSIHVTGTYMLMNRT